MVSYGIKSVVPPNDKDLYDLATEFYYTGCIPEHERIVSIFGSVIDHTYVSGSTPAVLLVMKRLNRDLYSATISGLDWLKNILLDRNNQAKITYLGSVVDISIHMSLEPFLGRYDNRVDVPIIYFE